MKKCLTISGEWRAIQGSDSGAGVLRPPCDLAPEPRRPRAAHVCSVVTPGGRPVSRKYGAGHRWRAGSAADSNRPRARAVKVVRSACSCQLQLSFAMHHLPFGVGTIHLFWRHRVLCRGGVEQTEPSGEYTPVATAGRISSSVLLERRYFGIGEGYTPTNQSRSASEWCRDPDSVVRVGYEQKTDTKSWQVCVDTPIPTCWHVTLTPKLTCRSFGKH